MHNLEKFDVKILGMWGCREHKKFTIQLRVFLDDDVYDDSPRDQPINHKLDVIAAPIEATSLRRMDGCKWR